MQRGGREKSSKCLQPHQHLDAVSDYRLQTQEWVFPHLKYVIISNDRWAYTKAVISCGVFAWQKLIRKHSTHRSWENATPHEYANFDNMTSIIKLNLTFQLYNCTKWGIIPQWPSADDFVVKDAFPDSVFCVYCNDTNKERVKWCVLKHLFFSQASLKSTIQRAINVKSTKFRGWRRP